MNEKGQPTVSVHTLEKTTNEQFTGFIDDGLFVDDLAEHGINLVISNRNAFDNNQIIVPSIDKSGEITYTNEEMDGSQIDAMHVRPVASINRPGSELVPKLNPNVLKDNASKYNLYKQILSDYQVPTHFLDVKDNAISHFSDIIENISTDNVVIKDDKGFGGTSNLVLSKIKALEWLESQVESSSKAAYIIQPEIMFGPLPQEIRAIGSQDNKDLLQRARDEKLLTELRMFVVKCKDKFDVIPTLRVMTKQADSMDHTNDLYLDIELPDDLHEALEEISKDVMNRASNMAGGVSHALCAVDYYFDQHDMPHIMEANFRSPNLPLTREEPVAGRAVHKAVANALADMATNKEEN